MKKWLKVWLGIVGVALTIALILTLLPAQVSISSRGTLSIHLTGADTNQWIENPVIYPSEIQTDRDKLFAVYSLIEQMRLEHNKVAGSFRSRLILETVPKDAKELEAKRKQGFIRDWCPEGFMLADTPENNSLRAKFRTYAHESKAKLKQLLAEQNRLKESIRWANYTSEQWKAVGKLELEEQDAIYATLFGDRATEKVKTTKATSPMLDELKALNLDDMPEKLGADPTEDFTTYTEVDEGSDVTKTADRITFTLANTRQETFYVYKDKTADHFDGDFEHLLKTEVTYFYPSSLFCVWMLANDIGDYYALIVGNKNFIALYSYNNGGTKTFTLSERDGASDYTDSSIAISLSTVYFLEQERDEAVGTYGTIYSYICTGDYWDDGGTQIDTLTVALHTSKKDFRYVYGLTGYDTSKVDARRVTGYVELLDLQEVACSEDITNTPSSWNVNSGTPVDASSNYVTGLTFFEITNNSGGAVDIDIKATDMTGGNTWTLSDTATPASMVYGLKAGLGGGDYTIIVKKNSPYNNLVTSLADEGTQQWGLKLYTPTAYTDGTSKSGTVTITATCV